MTSDKSRIPPHYTVPPDNQSVYGTLVSKGECRDVHYEDQAEVYLESWMWMWRQKGDLDADCPDSIQAFAEKAGVDLMLGMAADTTHLISIHQGC